MHVVCSPGIHTCASAAEGSGSPGDDIGDGVVRSTAAVLACPQATLALAVAGCAYGASALTSSGMPQVQQRHALARKTSADGHTLVAAECGGASCREGDWELPGQQMAGSCPDPDLGQAGVGDEPGGQQHHLSAAHMGVGSAASSATCSDNELGLEAATVFPVAEHDVRERKEMRLGPRVDAAGLDSSLAAQHGVPKPATGLGLVQAQAGHDPRTGAQPSSSGSPGPGSGPKLCMRRAPSELLRALDAAVASVAALGLLSPGVVTGAQ